MFRLLLILAVPLTLAGCGPASNAFAEEVGYDSLKTNANTPSLVRGQRSAFGDPYYGGGYGRGPVVVYR